MTNQELSRVALQYLLLSHSALVGASHQDLVYFFCFRGKQIQLPVSIRVFCLFDRALSFSHFALSILMFLTLHSAVCFLGSFPLLKLSAQELQTCSPLLDPKAPGLFVDSPHGSFSRQSFRESSCGRVFCLEECGMQGHLFPAQCLIGSSKSLDWGR